MLKKKKKIEKGFKESSSRVSRSFSSRETQKVTDMAANEIKMSQNKIWKNELSHGIPELGKGLSPNFISDIKRV